MSFQELPVNQALPGLCKTLSAGHAVLTAPPGSGKTTLVPLALLEQPWLAGQKILMLEPRRPAARLAARRLARLAGGETGGLVGYQVRMDRKIGKDTRIEVVTEGILTRRLQKDPSLQGVGLVIFDEFHERNLQADLGLALCLDVCAGLREDLRLLVMSATLDAKPLCRLLGAGHVQASGRQYPVEVSYLQAQDRREPLSAVPGLVLAALAEHRGDVLVFLPGRGEIERLAESLAHEPAVNGVALEKLYGDLPAREQDRILMPRPDGVRRVILSTDLAESSLTIEGVACVIDSGLSRKPRFDPNSGMTRLQRLPISVASADQRAGRAGRTGPGACYRAWTEARHARLLSATPPEIVSSDLTGLVLELALWGVTDPAALDWPDCPPAAHWRQAVEFLQRLDALNPDGSLTVQGRRMAAFGVEPRLARLLSAAANHEEAQAASDMAALLSERDLFAGRKFQGADLSLRLQALRDWRRGKITKGLDQGRLRAVQRLADALRGQIECEGAATPVRSAAELLSLAFPDRIARQRPNGRGRYLLANGRGALLEETDRMAGAPWLVVAALDAGQRDGRIWSAIEIAPALLEGAHGRHIQERRELYWDDKREGVMGRQARSLGAITLEERLLEPDDTEAAQGLLFAELKRRWPDGLPWDEAARQFLMRARRMAALQAGGDWPDVSEDRLKEGLDDWLAPWLGGRLRIPQLAGLDLQECLKGLLSWEQRQQLEDWLPTHYTTPAGSRRRIDYRPDGPPRVAVPLQEVFGQSASPLLAAGRQPLVLQLLNPAGRPLQVTADLGNFWAGAYLEVRKELRGRYPKHDWPEDPTAAVARRGTGRPGRA